MNTPPGSPPPIDPLVLRQNFREESEYGLKMPRSHAEVNYQASLMYAKLALQSGLTLNGGGLIAIPALTALLKVNTITAQCSLVFSYAIFAIGLTLILTSMVCAHFSTRRAHDAWWNIFERDRLRYVLGWGQSQTPPSPAQIQSEQDKANKRFWWTAFFDIAATVTGVWGGLTFVLGAIATFYVVIRYAGTATS